MTTPIQADRTLDCLGLFCPMPVVRIRETLATMGVGQVIALLSDDPGSDADVRTWTVRTGNELLGVERNGPVFRFLVRKAR